MANTKNLVLYFSRTGEQYDVGIINRGNTAIVAEIIARKTNADIYEIKLKNDTYPTRYTPLTEVAAKEKKAAFRPEIIDTLEDFDSYETVFIGTPNWWADMPMALYTFIESHNWSNKTIAPFVTHEGSGLSSIPSKLKTAANPKAVLEGLALYGHTAQNAPDETEKAVDSWLKKLGY